MKTYKQACGLAKALDVIGDRWSMLIVRELLIRGACRYTDLKNGLPGVATNLLAERMRELEAAGVVAREDAPAPVAATLFSLTEQGWALEPALLALGQWGATRLDPQATEEAFQAHWMVLPLRLHLKDLRPEEPPVTIAVVADGEALAIEVGGSVSVALARVARPASTLAGPGREVLALLTGRPVDSARRPKVTGDLAALARIIPAPAAV
jgi:DNA-binding HxlR family transcriptional regulator